MVFDFRKLNKLTKKNHRICNLCQIGIFWHFKIPTKFQSQCESARLVRSQSEPQSGETFQWISQSEAQSMPKHLNLLYYNLGHLQSQSGHLSSHKF